MAEGEIPPKNTPFAIRENWLAIAFLATLLTLLFGVFAYYSGPPLMCARPDETVPVCFRNWINAAGNVIAALIAVAAATYAARQVQVAREQAKSAQESARASAEMLKSDRAWILFDSLDHQPITNFVFEGNCYPSGRIFSARWINFGRTPALDVRLHFNIYIGSSEEDAPTFPEFTPGATPSGTTAPNQKARSTQYAIPSLILDEVMHKRRSVFVYSCVHYRDIYGAERYSEATARLVVIGAKDEKSVPYLDIKLAFAGPQQRTF